MYKEWSVRRKERRVIIDISHLYSHNRCTVLVSRARVVCSHLQPAHTQIYISLRNTCSGNLSNNNNKLYYSQVKPLNHTTGCHAGQQ